MNQTPKALSLTYLTIILASIILASGCAEFKSAGKTIGTASKEAATDIGHGTKRVFKEVTAE